MYRKFATVLSLLLIAASFSTPATAQFSSPTQVYVFTPEITSDNTIALRIYTTQCTLNNQMFFSLSKDNGRVWVDMSGIIPIGLEPLAPGVMKRLRLNLQLTPGTYKLTPSITHYGNANRNVDESKYCISGLREYTQSENIVFTVGGSAEPVVDAPFVMVGDRYSRLSKKEGEISTARFWASFQNATQLIISQEQANKVVRYYVVDQPATPDGAFQQISLDLPNNFDDSLPVDVVAKDRTTGVSTFFEVLARKPIFAADTAKTANR